MVPFIDVMLVLLIIFMVSAPLITTGVIDLPTVGKSQAAARACDRGRRRRRREARCASTARTGPTPSTLKSLAARVRELQAGDANTPVVISADKKSSTSPSSR
jgi:biopolymer transport protein TolR